MSPSEPAPPPLPPEGPDWAKYVPIAVMVVTTLIMVVAFFFGGELMGVSGSEGVARLLSQFRESPFAPLIVVAVFTVLGLTGFPQFLLIGGTVAIFGDWGGFVYSWVATMVSAALGFWLGGWTGASVLRRWGGATVNKASEIIGRHGILATIIVRLVPSGPFVVVNLVAGMSHIAFWRFAVGTGLGIVPKTALIAFVGGRLIDFLREQDPTQLAVVAVVLVVWMLAGLWVRKRFFAHVEARAAADTAAAAAEAQAEGRSDA